MATYLLLRNNKNSGPYSLEALIQLGLKPYDLVWVEGKSAAWRYPSEVEDLKFYAPVVEEQPYDRFYKKPSDAAMETEKKQVAIPETKTIQPAVNFSIPEEVKQSTKISEIEAPRKQVFVSLPANTGSTFIKRPEPVTAVAGSQPYAGVTEPYNELYNGTAGHGKGTEPVKAPSYSELVNEYNNYQPRENKIAMGDAELPDQIKQMPVETKYAQSLDDIKDMYLQTLADRKRKTAKKKMIVRFAKRGLPFAAVLVVGFIMGGYLMNRKNENRVAVQPVQNGLDKIVLRQEDKKELPGQTVLPQTQQQEKATGASLLDPSNATPNETSSTTNVATVSKSSTAQKDSKPDKTETTQIPLNVVKKFVAKQNEDAKLSNDNTSSLQKPQNIEADPRTGERSKVVRTVSENNTDNSSAATGPAVNSLMKQVNVKGNEYKVGTFGGIHDLQLTVVNNSNYLLDRVLVELQYLKPSEQPLKTNNIQFENVPPNGSLTLAIPATNRGTKVVYKVINVHSKAAGNDTARLQ